MSVLKNVLGVDRLLFGSDWPHAEGLPEPRDFAWDLRRHHFPEEDIRHIMQDNGRELTLRAT
jgi:predicted TIM-barrel fold metal-dependent hydrolase